MDCEFDCPQYVDFENDEDESHPEEYFETRQTRYGFSHSSSSISQEDSIKSEDNMESPEKSSFSPSTSGPSYNTRSAVKTKRSGRIFRVVSSQFRQFNGPPMKKLKKRQNSPKPVTIKHERKRSSVLMAERKRKLKIRKRVSANALKNTVPEPFSFLTDQRVNTIDVPEYKTVDFIATLRTNKENQNPVKTGPVRAIPERLLGKRKMENKKTMAEEVLSFQQALSNRAKPDTPDTKGAKLPRLTQPMSPSLSTACRSRPAHVMSQEEKEILEAEEMKRYHFKAQPLNFKILKPHALKAKKKLQKTKRVRVTLNTEKRAALRPRARSLEQPPEFHARPVPKKILQGVTGLGGKVVKEATEAHSPPFALKKREDTWKQLVEAKEKKAAELAAAAALETKFKSPRLRDRSISQNPLQTSFKKGQKVVPQPFSFDSRDQKMLERREERIKLILEEERKQARNFRANPLPSPSVSGLPQKKKMTPTKFQNFSLKLEDLGQQKSFKWHKKLEDELQQEKEARKFKAQACHVTISEPFLPKKSQKPATEQLSFDLHSEIRAAQRSKYEQEKKEKEEERLALMEERRWAEEELQNERIAEMRAKTVHKAKPVPHLQPFEVKRGLIPITEAVTPKFKTDSRLKRKHQ